VVFVSYSLGKDSHGADHLGSVAIGVSVDSHGLVDRAVFAGNLLVDWLADLPGHGGALLHLGGDGHADGDGPAVSDWLVHAGGLGDSPGDGGTLGDRLGVADGVGDLPGGGPALGPWNSNTLWNIDALGDSNAMRNSHTLGDSDTLGNSDTLRNSDTFWNSNTVGNLNGAGSLDRNLSALPVNLLMTLGSYSNWSSNSHGSNRSSNSNGSNGSSHSSRGSSEGKWCWASSKRTNWEGIESKELSISIGISFSISISITLAKTMVEKLRSSRNNTSWKSSSVDSKSGREKARSSNSSRKGSNSSRNSSKTSRNSSDSSRSSNSMTNNISMGLYLYLGLSADLMDDVIAFLNKSCFWDGLCHSGTLLLSGTLLGVSALLLGGTGLLSSALLGVSALLFGGTLGHISALLLSYSGALLVRDISHNVCALLLGVGGALLLGDLPGGGGALGDSPGVAFFLVFCSEVCDGSGLALRICDSGTGLGGNCVVGDGALGCIMFPVVVSAIATVTIPRVSLRTA